MAAEPTATVFGDEASRRHDFGAVIGRPGLTLRHAYPLVNQTDGPVRILRAVNHKPCCGDVALEPTTLGPGEAATLEVAIRVNQALGPIAHYAVVETDHPGAGQLDFETTVHAYSRARIEGSGRSFPSLLPDEEARHRFVASSCGTSDAPSLSLGDGDLESALAIRWDGPAEEREIDSGMTERSRPFSILLPADGRVGPRAEDIVLNGGEGEDAATRYTVRWEVVPPLDATSKMAVFTPERRECALLIRARDGAPFRVTEITFDAPGLRGDVQETAPARVQTVRVESEQSPADAGRPTTMSIVTNHPDQETVEVPLVFLD